MLRRLLIRLFVPPRYRWLTIDVSHVSEGERALIKSLAADMIRGLCCLEVPPHLKLGAVVERLRAQG